MPSVQTFIVAALAAATFSLAHIELLFPPPINSKYDPQTLEANKDYSMTSPLGLEDTTATSGYGFAYPCKGYNTAALIDALNPVATLEAGSDFSVNMSGTATHGGGSCQFSLSYDQGKTFAVIASIIGGCPTAEAYTIPVPKDVPAGTKALFAWTWQNLVGNREEYMNCAVVDVTGTSKSYTGPGLFRANTQGATQCRTVENEDVVYPNPGPSVQFLDSTTTKSSAATVLSPCSTDQDTSVTVTSNGGTVSGSSSSSGSSSRSSSSSSKPFSSSQIASAIATSSEAATSSVEFSAAVVGKVAIAAGATTTSTSSSLLATSASSTAIVASSSSAAASEYSSSAYITCTSATTWSLCGGSTCTPMGGVADGTQCVDALVVATVALAHIELIFPPGINSKYDPQTLEANKDYSMTSPLGLEDTPGVSGYGFAYPCKGYNTAALIGALSPVATLEAGTDFHVNMTGSATHGGGSCQFALSYDQGETFAVIASVIGGCPLAESYTIPVPKDVPAGTKALFAWTWQNLVGNREEYMNCAVVDVKGTSKSYTGPGLFRANTLGSSECRTVEHQDVVYPNPGPSVQYLGASTSAASPATVLSPCTNDQITSVTVTSNGGTVAPGTGGSSGSSSSPAPPSPPVVASSSAPIASFSKPIVASSTPIASSSTPTVPSATPPAVSRGPYSSAPAASSLTPLLVASRNSKKVAAPTPKPIPARKKPTKSAPAVAAAVSSTPVVASPAVVAPSAPQSGGAYVTCTSTTTFSLCGGSTCTPMGSVAPGTQCIGGQIIAAKMRSRRAARELHRRRVERHS